MSSPPSPGTAGAPDTVVSDDARHKAEEFIEAEEGAANKLTGWLGVFVVAVAFVMSAFHLYTAYAIVPTQTLRPLHVGFVLFLCFLVFPLHKRLRHRVMWWDWLAAALAIAPAISSTTASKSSPAIRLAMPSARASSAPIRRPV